MNLADRQDNGVNSFALAAVSSLLSMPNSMFDEPRERKMKEKWENEGEGRGEGRENEEEVKERREEFAKDMFRQIGFAYADAGEDLKNAKVQRLYKKLANEVWEKGGGGVSFSLGRPQVSL